MPDTTTTPTHAFGVQRLDRHEREDNGAEYTLTEPPKHRRIKGVEDLIAWLYGVSTVDEWKNSEPDLLADREKPQRQPNVLAVGVYRYYASDAYVIEPHQIKDAWGWGLKWRWPETDQIEVVKEAPPWHHVDQWAENMLLIAAAKRAERAAGTTAQEARKSQKNTVPPKYWPAMIEAVQETGGMYAIDIARGPLSTYEPKRNRGPIATKIRKTIPQIPELEATGAKTWVYPAKEGEADGE